MVLDGGQGESDQRSAIFRGEGQGVRVLQSLPEPLPECSPVGLSEPQRAVGGDELVHQRGQRIKILADSTATTTWGTDMFLLPALEMESPNAVALNGRCQTVRCREGLGIGYPTELWRG
jgi:hypothetical protein